MIPLYLIAVGRLKTGPYKEAFDDYARRLHGKLTLRELDIRAGGAQQTAAEHQAILSAIDPALPVMVLDERGKNMSSLEFAGMIQKQMDSGARGIQFVIGGADGLNDDIRARANAMISFGALTWPHMLARVMLAEQLYRAQQILAGHPYHRE